MTYQRTITIIIIMLVTAALTGFAGHSERILPNRPFSEFPLEIGHWKGNTSELDRKVYNILGLEDYILADYRKNSGETVSLYVGFYQSQKQGDIIHSPKNCMPGAGWKIMDTTIETVAMADTGKKIKTIKLLLQKGKEQQVVLYWFQSRGRIIYSEYMQKIWLVIDSVTKQRTDGSFVRLISPVTVDEGETIKVLKEFTKKVYPFLDEYIPS
ncbi:exosortase C-terminal domain/associated protein EpsI [Desulfobacula phenolica]|uniref:EpsI family protein n=1 Tax=Desulfobacula phenolica TaxID=90732 RepID=A0A1H2ENH8_9BACT|nr:exosortase C-terminal domain/associated protein EpsI [Desulfobacula phenolica]SDT96665.1 EpsI family protein [Desulfobacula phenolica]